MMGRRGWVDYVTVVTFTMTSFVIVHRWWWHEDMALWAPLLWLLCAIGSGGCTRGMIWQRTRLKTI